MSEQAAPVPAQKPGGGIRALAALAAVIMLVAGGIFITAGIDIGGTPTLKECNANPSVVPSDNTCYDGSKPKRLVQTIGLVLAGVIGVLSAIVGLIFTFTGTRGRLFLQLLVAAIVIGAVSLALDLI